MAAEDEAAGARVNAESQQGRSGRRDPLSLASGVSEVIAASPDLKAMLEAVARRVAEALGVWECNIYEYRSETDTLVATALWAGEVTPEDHAWLGTVYPMADRPSYQQMLAERTVREYQADDPAITDRERANMQRWGERSVFSLPLVFQDEVVGALTVVEKRAPRRFTDEDLRLLELMAVPAAVAAYSARMFRRRGGAEAAAGGAAERELSTSSTIDLEGMLVIAHARERRWTRQVRDRTSTLTPRPRPWSRQRVLQDGWERWGGEGGTGQHGRPATASKGRSSRSASPSRMEMSSMAPRWSRTGRVRRRSTPLLQGRRSRPAFFIETNAPPLTDEERNDQPPSREQAAADIHHVQLLRRKRVREPELALWLEVEPRHQLERRPGRGARHRGELPLSRWAARSVRSISTTGWATWCKLVALRQRVPEDLARAVGLEDEAEEKVFLEAGEVLEQRAQSSALL